MNKSKEIIDIVKYFQTKYGVDNIIINDHWVDDESAIGLSEKSKTYTAYISTSSYPDLYLALEDPATDIDMPYTAAGYFNNIDLKTLEILIVKHLKININEKD